eukprot:CAMPEP_0179259434 /NCGR_PEP_ID=MMETSP0797-20121207/25824_1 /TAXON_ID=47934 /ORGANISM="Dinophysis acuminata, Strain DAEP01" /LENGTH=226 /DNA_ID=CAMNT_0020967487 /DNA_START=16 /DNA_END=696 /DNA_ORIENTATION=+
MGSSCSGPEEGRSPAYEDTRGRAVYGGKKHVGLEDASIKIANHINQLERKIAKAGEDAKTWASRADTDPTARTRAMQLLKQKKMYEQQRDRLMGTHFNVEAAAFQQEQSEVTLLAARAMQQSHDKLRQQAEMLPVDELERMTDDIQELTHQLRESQDALARSGAVDGVGMDDCEAEFQALQAEAEAAAAAQVAARPQAFAASPAPQQRTSSVGKPQMRQRQPLVGA